MDALADYLAAVAPDLPAVLVSRDDLRSVAAGMRGLPGAVTSDFCLECRLGEVAAPVDLMLCATAAGGGRDILAGRHPAIPPPEAPAEDRVWARVREFCRAWADPESPLHDGVDYLWLEFDTGAPAAGLPTPSVFFSPLMPPADGRRREAGAHPIPGVPTAVASALALLRGAPLSGPPAQRLATCYRALPEQATVSQVGLMLARGWEEVRLCIDHLSPAQIPAYLARIGGERDPRDLTALLDDLAPRASTVRPMIDVGAAVHPRIGLECFLRPAEVDRERARRQWTPLLDHLVRQGLCLPDRRDALLAYPGLTEEPADSERWPAGLAAISSLLRGRVASVFLRTLLHVKIVYEPGRPLEAKGYLAVAQRWRERDTGRLRH